MVRGLLNNSIYFDEAGNTGSNLLDVQQPYHVLLSHNFTAAETNDLLHELIAAKSQGDELHFKSLKKSGKYQKLIENLYNNDLINSDRVYFSVSDKAYCVVAQIVDQLIEPVMYDVGYDLYKGGHNLILANYLHYLGIAKNKDMFDKMCSAFLPMMKNKDAMSVSSFYGIAFDFYNTLSSEEKSIFFPVLVSREQIASIFKSAQIYTLDVTLSNFMVHCNFWDKRINSKLDIYFDDSKQIEYYKGFIDFHTKNIPSAEVGYGSRKMRFPLQINKVKQCRSQDKREIQLADILASGISYSSILTYKKKVTDDPFIKNILTSRLLDIPCHTISPSPNLEDYNLEGSEEGENILDFLADVARKRESEYEKIRKEFRR